MHYAVRFKIEYDMKRLQIDSILLFSLVTPIIMTYRLSSGDTPYWLFGVIFLLLLGYMVLDILKLSRDLYHRLKDLMVLILVALIIGSTFWSAMVVRHQTAPEYNIHDIILQQEAAMRYLLDGKNPYGENYFGTPLENWHYSDTEVNPALYHFVMQPWYLLFSLPFYWVSFRTVGFFDGRMPLLFLFCMLLVNAWVLVKDKIDRRVFLILLSLSPGVLPYTLEGRSDIFMYAFLFFGWFMLYKHRLSLAGIPLALAFAVKQSVWPLFPLYVVYLLFVKDEHRTRWFVGKNLMLFFIVFISIVGPFIYWDWMAFLNSTVLYLTGSVPTSYPISGYGVGMVLYNLGYIRDLHAYYPFGIWQAIVGIPVLIILIRYIIKDPSVYRLIISYGIFLMVYWYFSRYFNNSHVAYISLIFLTAYFWPNE